MAPINSTMMDHPTIRPVVMWKYRDIWSEFLVDPEHPKEKPTAVVHTSTLIRKDIDKKVFPGEDKGDKPLPLASCEGGSGGEEDKRLPTLEKIRDKRAEAAKELVKVRLELNI
jgi:hypothetical protein